MFIEWSLRRRYFGKDVKREMGQSFQAKRTTSTKFLRLGRSPQRGREGPSVAAAVQAGGEEEEPIRSQTQREVDTAHRHPCWPMELGPAFGPIYPLSHD